MSTAENQTVIAELTNALDHADFATVDRLVAADYVDHQPYPGQAPTREGFKQFAAQIAAAFPDMHTVAEDFVSSSDKVVMRWSARCTHANAFQGIPPTGKQIRLTGIEIYRVAGGKVVERWGEVDALALLQQLGAIPMPSA